MTNRPIHMIVEELLSAIEGDNYDRQGLKGTPRRVESLYAEVFSGYRIQDPSGLLQGALFNNDAWDENNPTQTQMVIVKDIDFYSHCEHHMVPFFGHIHIGYIPKESVVGLSKLVRVANLYAKRLQIQERLTEQIADCIQKVLDPQGVMVVCNAEHLCMKMRGVRNASSNTTTSAIRGVFKDASVRSEFLSLLKV